MGIKDIASKVIEFERNQRHAVAERKEDLSRAKAGSKAKREQTKAARVETRTAKKEAKRAKREGYEGRDINAVLPDHERERILVEEIKKLTAGWGSPWKIQAQGPTWAQLVDPAGDPIGTGGTVMAVATLGLSLAATPARRGRNNDKHLYIDVEPNGTVNRSGSLLYGGTDYSNVPMLDD